MKRGRYKGKYMFKYRKGFPRFWKWGRNPFGDYLACTDLKEIGQFIESKERLSGEAWEESKF